MSQMHAEDDSLLARAQKPAVSTGDLSDSLARPSDSASSSIRPHTTPLSEDEAKAHMEAFSGQTRGARAGANTWA